jgi:hypothetical protein
VVENLSEAQRFVRLEHALLVTRVMNLRRKAVQYGQRRIMRKLLRSVPFLGGLVAVATVARAVRHKGVVGGTLDTALDVIPFVSGAKNVMEIARGRDFIGDRPGRRR